MPDILIRGWDVPKGCGVCPLNTGAFYCAGLKRYAIEEENVWMVSNYRRLKDCPLLELPLHGDLIDRDALIKECNEMSDEEWNTKAAPYSWAYAYESFADDVEEMPVIVPSNKEESE